jgi:bacterioferritin
MTNRSTRPTARDKEAPMADNTAIVALLNDLRAAELTAIVLYMRHHYLVTGVDGMAVADEFKAVSIDEMKHAEKLAERIDFLGGDPTTRPNPIATDATTLAEMATQDLAAEDQAVADYTAAIAVADAAGDIYTRRLLEDILADEVDHQNTFGMMLGK